MSSDWICCWVPRPLHAIPGHTCARAFATEEEAKSLAVTMEAFNNWTRVGQRPEFAEWVLTIADRMEAT